MDNLLLNYKTLTKFNQKFYSTVITDDNVQGTEINMNRLTLPDTGEETNFWGWIIEKNNEKYLLSSTNKSMEEIKLKNTLPIKILNTQKVSYRGQVYHLIKNYKEVRIKEENRLSYKECIDKICSFQHTNKTHQTLLGIITTALYANRGNIRLSTPPGFGKDSMVQTLNLLLGKAHSIAVPVSGAKLEMLFTLSKLLAINEANDLGKADWSSLEQYLLDTGDFKPGVTKRSRKFEGVGEFIDTNQLSLIMFYNDIDCYPDHVKYFDFASKEAVKDRFLPLRLNGNLTENFTLIDHLNVDELVEQHMETIKTLVYSLNYHLNNYKEQVKRKQFDVEAMDGFTLRWKQNMNTILEFIALYADDQNEFNKYSQELYKCFADYHAMLEYPKYVDLINDENRKLYKHQKTFRSKWNVLKPRMNMLTKYEEVNQK